MPDETAQVEERFSGAPGDERMEMVMGLLLRLGVLLAATVVVTGGVMYLVDHPGGRVDYSRFVANPIPVRHLEELVRPDAKSVLELGILLLIATPICRVAFAVAAFVAERDWLYVAVSVIVLAVLLYGMVHGG
ncbi:MAG TPA: DUF1634 domain-containing protein [Acidobacteriaceae bacterium]|nr:DUF1634 domain-containing protein [Acidobacteriaceae bacterium]